MERMRDRTNEDNGLPAASAHRLFLHKISWLKMPQGSRKVEMIQLSPSYYGTVTMVAAAARDTKRTKEVSSMQVEMVPACRGQWFRQCPRQP